MTQNADCKRRLLRAAYPIAEMSAGGAIEMPDLILSLRR